MAVGNSGALVGGWVVARRPSQASYSALERKTDRQLVNLTGRLADGKITLEKWQDRFLGVLEQRHSDAWTLGRQRAGDSAAQSQDDTQEGAAITDGEARFLQRFADDIAEGRYAREDGTLDKEKLQKRAGFYAKRLLGSCNEAFVTHSDPDATFDWVMGSAEHCDDCPALAAGSPYSADVLWTFPRSGATQCLFHCKCHLKRSDKITGFLPT